jgi:hypothetical protein
MNGTTRAKQVLLVAALALSAGTAGGERRPSPSPEARALAHVEAAGEAPSPPLPMGPAPRGEALPRAAIRETDEALPRDLAIRVTSTADATKVEVRRPGELVVVRHGDERVGGASGATLEIEDPRADELVLIETTRPKTLATTRVVVRLGPKERSGGTGAPFVARLAEAPRIVARDERAQHTCRAHDDGLGGFAVLCHTRTQPNAASVTGDDAHENVFTMTGAPDLAAGASGPSSLVRFDLDARRDSVDAKMLAYNSRGKGVIVRAEASFLPGEASPSLALLSDGRAQPVPRFGCSCGG